MKKTGKILGFIALSGMLATATHGQELNPKSQPVLVKPATAQRMDSSPQPAGQGQKDAQAKGIKMPPGGGLAAEWLTPSGELSFMDLPYKYDALEPYIDKMTVEIHYSKHHRGYFDNFRKAITETELVKMPVYEIFAEMSNYSDAVRNNAGGYFNHALYWENLTPEGKGKPSGRLAAMIDKQFESFGNFVETFNGVAKSRFGSGWAWLSVDLNTGELFISSTPNQDNPLMNISERHGIPILALDVWEHAYYLKYQNKRGDYIDAFWKLVNWPVVEQRYKTAMESLDLK